MSAYVTGTSINSFGVAISTFVEMLVSAGWSYKASGDGLSGFSSTGKIFTGTGSGANGWNNTGSWARVQDPSTTREFIIQLGATGTAKIAYSAAAKFTTGGNSTTVPTATDSTYVLGASGANQQFWPSTLTTTANTFYGMADSSAPYGFWFASSATSVIQSGVAFDPVKSVASDPDPYVWHIGTSGTSAAFTMAASSLGRDGGSTGGPTTWALTPGGSNYGAWAHMTSTLSRPMLYVQPASWTVGSISGNNGWNINGSTGGAQGFAPMNPFSLTKVDPLPVAYIRTHHPSTHVGVHSGIKGWSQMFRWTGLPRTSFTDTLNNKQYICVGAFWVPWDGTTTPVG